MKKYIIFLFLLVQMIPFASAMQISEVYYNPVGTESGGEAVEIFNPSDQSVDISGWALMTESSATDVTFPLNTSVPAHSFFLVADMGWSSDRDDLSWPEADYEEAITLANSDSGVALVDDSNNIIDAVGWGDASGIDPLLFELSPAEGVSEGFSLRRVDETDDNSFDFVSMVPGLKNSSYGLGNSIELGLEVTTPTCNLTLVRILDEDSDPGNQVLPFPGDDKLIPVELSGDQGLQVYATLLGQTYNLTGDSHYTGNLSMKYSEVPGVYTVEIFGRGATTTCNLSVDFDYQSMTAVSIDTSDLQFGKLIKGSSTDLLGDLNPESSAPTIKNIGNTLLDLGVYGDDLVSGSDTIPISNVIFSLDNDFGSSLASPLSSQVKVMDTNLQPSESLPLGIQVTIPATAVDGIYSGAIFVTALGE